MEIVIKCKEEQRQISVENFDQERFRKIIEEIQNKIPKMTKKDDSYAFEEDVPLLVIESIVNIFRGFKYDCFYFRGCNQIVFDFSKK